MTVVTATSILRGSCKGPSLSPVVLHSPGFDDEQPLPQSRRPSTIPAEDPETEKQLERVLNQLTPDELETAARSDYEYLQNPQGRSPKIAARHLALRYLKSKKDPQLALDKLKATISFRQKIDIDGLRLAFDDPFSDYAEPLEKFLASGKNLVQSYDKEGRATHVFVPRNTQRHHEVWTLKESLYTMERAIACSQAPDQSVNVILDCRGFHPVKHAPPMTLGKNFLLTLRHYYAGQVHRIFILDAPSSFVWVWKIFKNFVGTATQNKIVFCSGTKQKETVLGDYYAPDQATQWMLPLSGRMVDRQLDTDEYLWKTPFNRAFNE